MSFLSGGSTSVGADGRGGKRAGRRRTGLALFYAGLTLGGLSWGVFAAGCATNQPPVATVSRQGAAAARLVVENLTDYAWRLSATLPTGAEIWAGKVGPRAALEVELAGGDYVIQQAVISGVVGQGLIRHLPARFESGQTYRWRLGTLLSKAAADPAYAGREPAEL